jgi:hypothetical protein
MKKIVVIFAVSLCVVVLLFWVFKKSPANNGGGALPSPTPETFASMYRGLAPGTSTENDAVAALGRPLRKDEGAEGTTLVYSSGIGNQPINVDVTSNGIISRINEPVDSSLRYNSLVEGFGSPDLILYGVFEREGFRLFVFLNRGIAFLANPQSQEVKERWHFPQADAETFRRVFAPNMSLQSTLGQQ